MSSGSTDNIQGVKGSIHTTNFNGDQQCETVRYISAHKDSDNEVAVGWTEGSQINKTNQTVYDESVYNGVALGANYFDLHPGDDTLKDYQLGNGNGGNSWTVSYQGSSIDSLPSTFVNANKLRTASKRFWNNDDMTAHFEGLNICTSSSGCTGNYHAPTVLQQDFKHADSWFFCTLSGTSHNVRQNSC